MHEDLVRSEPNGHVEAVMDSSGTVQVTNTAAKLGSRRSTENIHSSLDSDLGVNCNACVYCDRSKDWVCGTDRQWRNWHDSFDDNDEVHCEALPDAPAYCGENSKNCKCAQCKYVTSAYLGLPVCK